MGGGEGVYYASLSLGGLGDERKKERKGFWMIGREAGWRPKPEAT